jgi:hypothetical protein
MGIALFLLGCTGCAAYVISHSAMAAVFVGLGLLVIIFSGNLRGLVLLKLETKFGALMAKFMKDPPTTGRARMARSASMTSALCPG